MKKCTKCLLEKSFSNFHSRGDSNGYRSYCKVCYRKNYNEKRTKKTRNLLTSEELAINRKKALQKHRQKSEYKIKHAIESARRRAAKLQATPKWLSEFHKENIEHFYALASYITQLEGTPWHVDHEIPLRGENVCGLHVPWNLQIMEGRENSRKGNRT